MVAAAAAFATGCFGDAPGNDETTTGPTTSGSTTDPSTTGPTTSSETTIATTDAPTTSTTDTTADTTIDPTMADSSTSTSSDDGSSSSSESTGPGVIEPTFFDDFARNPSQSLGNGWVEKSSTVFALADERVVADSNFFHPYYDQVVTQEETVLDVELSVEFSILTAADQNEPHLIARMQPDGLVPAAFNHCYALVPQVGLDQFCAMRFDTGNGGIGQQWCTPWPNASFVEGDWYRLVFLVEGPGPVELSGRLEHLVGDEWELVVAVEDQDLDDELRITSPGAWGFSGGTSGNFYNNFVFDNFSAYYR